MNTSGEGSGPYPFTSEDLQPSRLQAGVRHTLADFEAWQRTNTHKIAGHVLLYGEQLERVRAENTPAKHLGRLLIPKWEHSFRSTQTARELGYFMVYNLSEMPDQNFIATASKMAAEPASKAISQLQSMTRQQFSAGEAVKLIAAALPDTEGIPEMKWLETQLRRLYRMLPEHVIQEGGMGKVLRTITGVLMIGAFDTRDESRTVRQEHLASILPAAYAYGATYPIIDDTLHDSNYIPGADRTHYHQVIGRGLATGELGDTRSLPDHPLSDELYLMYEIIRERFPFTTHRHLYQAAQSMYEAQHRDAQLTLPQAEALGGIPAMYPDMFIKSSMSRVVANIIGRRQLGGDYYRRGINTTFITQLRDDIGDIDQDRAAGRLTPFTYPPEKTATNPLQDMLAYEAYIIDRIYGGSSYAAESLAFIGSTVLASRLPAARVEALEAAYQTTPGLRRYMRTASRLPRRTLQDVVGVDKLIQYTTDTALHRRNQTELDPRTFISDRLPYINDVLDSVTQAGIPNPLRDIASYALEAGGKRLRPALTLMLAESLGQPVENLRSLLVAAEYFHTASLLFDDLPAQDNARQRRGMPTAHTAYPEGDVQVTGIGMISAGFGILGELQAHYPPSLVADVVSYVGTTLGLDRLCLGQYMDLHMTKGNIQPSGEDIIKMYELKTSTALEAALVPLMMLTKRPAEEIASMQRYARHAGIVFQLRDDILDVASTTATIGKDAGNDENKINIVRAYGLDAAQLLMEEHVQQAVDACRTLPFNTDLLQATVAMFASRRK